MKEIKDYENQYAISRDGRVWSHKRQKFMALAFLKTGYARVTLKSVSSQKKTKSFLVHRLVAQAYLENAHNKPEVNHINCNRSDNRVENLEWVTRSENNQHAWDKGAKQFKMTDNFRARRKLSKEQSQNLIAEYKAGKISQAELGRKYGIKQHSVWNIINGVTYAE